MPSAFVRNLLVVALAGGGLHAAVIRGTVVENRTGKFLARTTVTVHPIAGTPGAPVSKRTNVTGLFEFSGLAGGVYRVTARRDGFMPFEYGQKRWNSAGQPVFVEESASAFLSIRLLRFTSISGTVVDENDIGLQDRDVAAYRNSQPPQLLTRGRSDDRGAYRIAGLEPGTYLVRAMGADDEEGSFLPTFSKEAISADNARIVELYPELDAERVEVRPRPGKPLTVSGMVTTEGFPMPANVTIASSLGRQSVVTADAFRFSGLMPGRYELYGEAPIDNNPNAPFQGAYLSGGSEKDAFHNLLLTSRGAMRVEVRGADRQSLQSGAIQLMARRKDLAGNGPLMQLKPSGDSFSLRQGTWEIHLVPPPGYYVSEFVDVRRPARGAKARPDTWNEVTSSGIPVRFTLSGNPSSLHGIVKSGSEVVIGAPVFLEACDEENRQRLMDPQVTWTDRQGRYTFGGLAPGTYRVLATFEYSNPDAAAMDLAGAQSIRIEPLSAPQKDLSLYVIP